MFALVSAAQRPVAAVGGVACSVGLVSLGHLCQLVSRKLSVTDGELTEDDCVHGAAQAGTAALVKRLGIA